MKITEKILELATKYGSVRSKELFDLGYSRTHIERGLLDLLKRNRIFKHGSARATYYTTNKLAAEVPVMKPGQKTYDRKVEMPDLPDHLLLMMGYTRTPVNERHARHVEGW